MKDRFIGSAILAIIGLLVGSGTGIVGGAFGAVAGVFVFMIIGAAWGWSAGLDIMHVARRWKKKS
jgi:hypothetical protein